MTLDEVLLAERGGALLGGLIEWLGSASLPSETGINNRVTEMRCCGNDDRFSKVSISAIGDLEIRVSKIRIMLEIGILE